MTGVMPPGTPPGTPLGIPLGIPLARDCVHDGCRLAAGGPIQGGGAFGFAMPDKSEIHACGAHRAAVTAIWEAAHRAKADEIAARMIPKQGSLL